MPGPTGSQRGGGIGSSSVLGTDYPSWTDITELAFNALDAGFVADPGGLHANKTVLTLGTGTFDGETIPAIRIATNSTAATAHDGYSEVTYSAMGSITNALGAYDPDLDVVQLQVRPTALTTLTPGPMFGVVVGVGGGTTLSASSPACIMKTANTNSSIYTVCQLISGSDTATTALSGATYSNTLIADMAYRKISPGLGHIIEGRLFPPGSAVCQLTLVSAAGVGTVSDVLYATLGNDFANATAFDVSFNVRGRIVRNARWDPEKIT